MYLKLKTQIAFYHHEEELPIHYHDMENSVDYVAFRSNSPDREFEKTLT